MIPKSKITILISNSIVTTPRKMSITLWINFLVGVLMGLLAGGWRQATTTHGQPAVGTANSTSPMATREPSITIDGVTTLTMFDLSFYRYLFQVSLKIPHT